MKNKFKLLSLLSIILLASFLRLYKLGELPSGIYSDDLSIAYDAYSILKTGKDQWGVFSPLDYFKSFGDYKLPLYHYLTIPSIFIFGLNEFSARLPSAFFGILTVILTYFLTKELFKSSRSQDFLSKGRTRNGYWLIPLISSFLLAINPWHIVLSRTGHEITVSIFLIVLGVFLFIKGNLFFFLTFFLGAYTYHTARVFIPLILPILFFLYRKNIRAKGRSLKTYSLFYFFLFLLPFLLGFSSEIGRARVFQTMGIPRIDIVNTVNERRGLCLQCSLPGYFCRLFYNKILFFGIFYLKNYINYFSPFTFFTHGIPGSDIFSVAGRSLFYLFELPLVLIGALLFFKSKNTYKRLIAVWLLLYPVPGSLIDFSTSRRMILIIPVLHIFASLGIWEVWEFIRERIKSGFFKLILITGFLFVICYSLLGFILDALEYNVVHARDFKYGYKEMVKFVKENEHKYEQIFITYYYDDHSYIYYLFFSQHDPLSFQDENNIEREMVQEEDVGEWLKVYRIGKIHFFNTFNWKEIPANSLFVIEPNRKEDLIREGTEDTRRVLKKIKDLDNKSVFLIVEVER